LASQFKLLSEGRTRLKAATNFEPKDLFIFVALADPCLPFAKLEPVFVKDFHHRRNGTL
jgi:hypothetical protein